MKNRFEQVGATPEEKDLVAELRESRLAARKKFIKSGIHPYAGGGDIRYADITGALSELRSEIGEKRREARDANQNLNQEIAGEDDALADLFGSFRHQRGSSGNSESPLVNPDPIVRDLTISISHDRDIVSGSEAFTEQGTVSFSEEAWRTRAESRLKEEERMLEILLDLLYGKGDEVGDYGAVREAIENNIDGSMGKGSCETRKRQERIEINPPHLHWG